MCCSKLRVLLLVVLLMPAQCFGERGTGSSMRARGKRDNAANSREQVVVWRLALLSGERQQLHERRHDQRHTVTMHMVKGMPPTRDARRQTT